MNSFTKAVAFATSLLSGASVTAETIYIDLDARSNGPSNAVYQFLEAGEYDFSVVLPEHGAKYSGHHAWAGHNRGCDPNGKNCSQGWQVRMYMYAGELTMAPAYDNTQEGGIGYLCLYPITMEEFQAGEGTREDTMFATPELAMEAVRQRHYSCRVTVEESGTFMFYHGDSTHSDNLGGNSYKLERLLPEPEVVDQPTDEEVFGGHGNNGWGNGDQNAPGNSGSNNNAENSDASCPPGQRKKGNC